jgi:hypothetical protein
MSSNQQIQNMSAAKKIKVQKPKKTRFPTCVWNYIKDFANINNSKIMNRFLQPIPAEKTKIIKRLQKIWKEIKEMPFWARDINDRKFQNERWCFEGQSKHKLMTDLRDNLCQFEEDDLKEFYRLKIYIVALELTEENSGCVTAIKDCVQTFQEENPD